MVIFRIIRNLLRLGFNLILWPMLLFGRGFGLFLIIGLVLLFLVLRNDSSEKPAITFPSETVTSAASGPPLPPPTINDPNAPPLKIDKVRTREDGNSGFAQDLMKRMSEPERIYYSQIFYWTMNHAEAGKPVSWTNMNSYGRLTPDVFFINGRGMRCRNFTEILKVQDVEQTLRGIACERGEGAWCKLRPNATPTCRIGAYQPSLWDSIKRSLSF